MLTIKQTVHIPIQVECQVYDEPADNKMTIAQWNLLNKILEGRVLAWSKSRATKYETSIDFATIEFECENEKEG